MYIIVPPTSERSYNFVVTSGMSEKRMPVPKSAEDGRFAELVMALPPDWPLTQEAFKDEANWWPFRLIKGLARYPIENKTWLYEGHSLVWSNPPKPFAQNTSMTSVLLLKPMLLPAEAQIVHVRKNKRIRLWAVFPVYQEELELKVRDGSDKLEELFRANRITELLDPKRSSVAPLM